MSHLGNLIIEVGPFAEGEEFGGFGAALTNTTELNALREDMLALACLRERVPRWVEMIDGDTDWSLGYTVTALNEMRDWAAAGEPREQHVADTETSPEVGRG